MVNKVCRDADYFSFTGHPFCKIFLVTLQLSLKALIVEYDGISCFKLIINCQHDNSDSKFYSNKRNSLIAGHIIGMTVYSTRASSLVVVPC